MNKFNITLDEGQKLFLTSDTHFGHENIINYCKRPFANAEHMDAEMIRRWNEVVRDDDVVIHLGDFAFKTKNRITEIRGQLRGHVYLVMGNHDVPSVIEKSQAFDGVAYDFVANGGVVVPGVTELIVNNATAAFLSHYPLKVWQDMGTFPLFFGHVHTSHVKADKSSVMGSYDVGADQNDFRPMLFDVACRKAWRQ